jgi:hypothetical protein
MLRLLPHRFKKAGWLLLVPSFLTGLFILLNGEYETGPTIRTFGWFGEMLFNGNREPAIRWDKIELLHNLVSLLFLVGGMLVLFSKEKLEDEYINQLRLRSFQSAVFINYVILFFCILFIHGIPFLQIMISQLFTVMIIYIIRFHYLIYKTTVTSHE